jgi:hypothetical protein
MMVFCLSDATNFGILSFVVSDGYFVVEFIIVECFMM